MGLTMLKDRALPIFIFCLAVSAHGAEKPNSQPTGTPKQQSEIAPEADPNSQKRNFYQVIEDVLSDFEYDLKNNGVSGLRDLSIKNIVMSENVPPSFKSHLELLITERILKHSRTKIIQCLECRSKRATLNGDSMVISSPDTNPKELNRIAKTNGIQNFMDVAFAYQPKGMILSLIITEPENGTVVWSRSYNSETSRAAAIRRGVDYSQVEQSLAQKDYTPSIQYRLIAYYLYEPDLSGYNGNIGLGFRMVERYDNRKKEVGFELDYLMGTTAVTGGNSASGTESKTIYSGLNLTMLFIHAWNFIGPEENYNLVRGSFFAGIGGTYAAGFLGGLVRVGYEWRMAKHWGVSGNLGFRPEGTAFIGSSTGKTVTGVEAGLGISYLF